MSKYCELKSPCCTLDSKNLFVFRLDTLWLTPPHSSHRQSSVLFVYELSFLRLHMLVRSYCICHPASGLFHSTVSSRFIHAVQKAGSPFFFMTNKHFFCCFHVLAIVNNAALNVRVQISFQDNDFILWIASWNVSEDVSLLTLLKLWASSF